MSRTWMVFGAASSMFALGCSSGGPVAAYESCSQTSDCVSTVDGCGFVQVDYGDRRSPRLGLCTNNCTSDAQCPLDVRAVSGACLSFDGGEVHTCFERCVDDNDCSAGFGCIDRLPDGRGGFNYFEPICLPR